MNLAIHKAFFLILFLIGSGAYGQCTVKAESFQGSLNVTAEDVDGFPTQLGMPTDLEDLPFVLLTCKTGTNITINILKPFRAKNGGPLLKGPFNSYFYYEDKVYDRNQTLKLAGGFENRPVRVRLTLSNGGNILPASNEYQYMASLVITTTVQESELETAIIDKDRILFSLESNIFNSEMQK